MKRRDLIKRINKIAKDCGETAIYNEGGDHTKVAIGRKQTSIPGHTEINEMTAKDILNYLKG